MKGTVTANDAPFRFATNAIAGAATRTKFRQLRRGLARAIGLLLLVVRRERQQCDKSSVGLPAGLDHEHVDHPLSVAAVEDDAPVADPESP